MAKAILIIEKPKSCGECQLFYNTAGTKMCEAIGRLVECEETRQEWCPLREVPQKKGLFNQLPKYDTDIHYEQGYNACIDEILGGGE